MATNTGGGTTASLSNTPQAQDDSFILPEDYNSVKWLDVMANDLGGNAKILWSLDDSATDALGVNDLILNLAIGGDWAGAKGIDDAAMPQRMEVDYVRVWQSPKRRRGR